MQDLFSQMADDTKPTAQIINLPAQEVRPATISNGTKCTIYEMDRNTGQLVQTKNALLEVGQIIFLNGYGQDEYHHERKAIYEVENDRYGLKYKYVNLDKPATGITEAYSIKPIEQKFGIGTYYKSGDIATPEEIQTALNLATIAAEEARIKKDAKEQEYNRISELGRQIIEANKPGYTAGFIVAQFEEDESDPMSDYFGSRTGRKVILAWTHKNREDFKELRTACLNCDIPEIRALAELPKEDENRENYTGGHGYYLGKDRYRGWQVRKAQFYNENSIKDFYYCAGHENGFYAVKGIEEPAKETKSTTDSHTPAEPTEIQLIDYSERSFMIYGDTRPIKDQLKNLGGKFNGFLTHPTTGQKVKGWIFSKNSKDNIRRTLGL